MRDDPILVHEEPLLQTFIPERLLHRDGQLKEILSCIKSVLHNKDTRIVLVFGAWDWQDLTHQVDAEGQVRGKGFQSSRDNEFMTLDPSRSDLEQLER